MGVSQVDNTYLIHHGIKGQKWGVRRYQNEDGSYTNAGRRRLRGSERTQNKIDRIQKRIDKSDHNVIARNTINDYRRGKLQELTWKRDYQKSKEQYKDTRKAYKRGEADRSQVRKDQSSMYDNRNRYQNSKYVRDWTNAMLPFTGRQMAGGYERRRSVGYSVAESALKSVGAAALTYASFRLAKKGAIAVGNKAYDSILDEAIRRQQESHRYPRLPRGETSFITDFNYTIS